MANGHGPRSSDAIVLPKWLATVITSALLLMLSGGTAWLFRMESRVSVTETNSQWTQSAILRIESKLDRILDRGDRQDRAASQ